MAENVPVSPDANSAFSLIVTQLSEADSIGDKYKRPGAADRSIHVAGSDFGGGTVRVQGSNMPEPGADDADWFTLTDGVDNPLLFTGPGGANIAENCIWYRVKLEGATGGAVTTHLFSRRTT